MKVKNSFNLIKIQKILGLLALLLALWQVVTGLLAAFYLTPSTDKAYESIRFLRTRVFLGDAVVSIHAWGATLLILVALLLLFVILLRRRYLERPKIWIFAVLGFFLLMNQDLTGRILPFHQTAYWQVTRSLEALSFIPIWGPFLRWVTQSLHGITQWTYLRFYILHLLILPGALGALLVCCWKGWAKEFRETSTSRVRDVALRFAEWTLLTVAVLATLALIFPPRYGRPVDILQPYEGARAVWYLVPYHSIARFLPASLGGGVLALILFTLFLIPWIDGGKRPLFARLWMVGVVLFYGLLILIGG